MGFGTNMINWLMSFFSTTSLSFLVNGVPCEPLKIRRFFRQGDPISSFLFNMVAKALNFVISKGCEKGLIYGLQVGVDNVCLTHLQYVDDTILFLP